MMTQDETLLDYQTFLHTKRVVAHTAGIEIPHADLHARLFPFQRVIVQWALRKGRAALFADCFLPGVLVRANGKYRPIEECQVGMTIETLQGSATIERFIEKDYEGDIVEVATASGFFPLHVTTDHKFYVLRRQRCVIRSRQNTLCSTECDRDCPREGQEPHAAYAIELVAAKDLTIDDCLLYRQPLDREGQLQYQDAYLRLAGYWLAEGSLGSTAGVEYQVTFNLGIDEEHTLGTQIVADLALLGLRGRIERHKEYQNVCIVATSSRQLAQRLKNDCGSGAHAKHLPGWFTGLNRRQKLLLLTALFQGDAFINTRAALPGERLSENIRYVTVSYELASGVRDALLGIGIRCSAMTEPERVDNQGITHRTTYRILIPRRFMAEFGYTVPVIRRDLRQVTHSQDGQTYTLIPVRALKRNIYTGKVYNLTSSGHDSYLTDAGTSKNCGLGKSFMQLEWASVVHQQSCGDVLILAPLAVAGQTIAEGAKLGIAVQMCRSQSDVRPGLNITNYEMLSHFDTHHFLGVVCDESSILKSYMGKTKRALVEAFAHTPYRLCCTATPASNDVMEISNHAEFLGIMPSSEMLMRWFINDSMQSGHYRLKGHATKDFWQWVASWAISIKKPSDLERCS